MKKLLGILLLLSGALMAETVIKFKDTVRNFDRVNTGYTVSFQEHAAIYHILETNKDYKLLEGKLKKSKLSGTHMDWAVNPETLEILK